MKKLFKSFIKPFLSKYEVVCTNYHVIPGLPVNKNQQTHTFERGAAAEAREFYIKVVSSEMTKTMAPVEVQLRKIYLRGKTMEQKQFGPVEQLKKITANKK
ncbi:hypothetical protein [uncultured Pontibacter sp.]|uniref:hypothetical protein n=1 Tax=uncultured Pontibacter sp. TaxID=453356 RepID=UPI00262B2E0E|nr:hypothetical protein [uncultured Pontibacter sp.]